MRDAEIDEARLLATRNHLDREAEHRARLAQELSGVLRHAQRVRAHCAHALARKAAQPLGEFAERLQRGRLRGAIDPLLGGEPAAQSHHLAHGVERIDLPLHDAPDHEVKAVRAEIDRGERLLACHAATVTWLRG